MRTKSTEAIERLFFKGMCEMRETNRFTAETHAQFWRLGIHSGTAFIEIVNYFERENQKFQETRVTSTELFWSFLDQMSFKYAGAHLLVPDEKQSIIGSRPEFRGKGKQHRGQKNDTDAGDQKSKQHRAIQQKKLRHADELSAIANEGDAHSVQRTFRQRRGHSPKHVVQPEPLSRKPDEGRVGSAQTTEEVDLQKLKALVGLKD